MADLTQLIARNVLQAIKDFGYGINAGHAIKHARTRPAQQTQQTTAEVIPHLSTREQPEQAPLLSARRSTA